MFVFTILTSVFILSFLLFFIFINRGNRRESEEERLSILMTGFVALMLSMIPVFIAAFFLFVVFGSANVIKTLFSLEISKSQLLLLSVIYLIYLFSLDNLFQVLIKIITGNVFLFYFILLWLRIVSLYAAGILLKLAHHTNLIIAIGAAVIISLIELLYDVSQRKKSSA